MLIVDSDAFRPYALSNYFEFGLHSGPHLPFGMCLFSPLQLPSSMPRFIHD